MKLKVGREFRSVMFALAIMLLLWSGCVRESVRPQPNLNPADPIIPYQALIRTYAREGGFTECFLASLIMAESSALTDAVSIDGCRGLTQICLRTARQYLPTVTAADLHDPAINLSIAVQHLSWLQRLIRRRFPDISDVELEILLVAAWNAGWSRVRKAGGVPHIRETEVLISHFRYFRERYCRHVDSKRFSELDR